MTRAEYLLVTMGGRRCGIPAERVITVLRRVGIHAFPAEEAAFLGLARYSSDAVAIFDGATLFGLRESPGPGPAEPVVVMVSGGAGRASEPFGLLVEEAERMVSVGKEGETVPSPEEMLICDPAKLVASRGRDEP